MIPARVFEETLLRFFEPIRPYLDDPTVTEVMINGPSEVLVERGGRIEKTTAAFSSPVALHSALQNLAQYVGRRFDEESPILEARLPDGSRVQAVAPPVAPNGPNVAIRRFSKDTLTMQRLVSFGAVSQEGAELLAALVACTQNMVISGGTGSGKTSLLNALTGFVDQSHRVVVIEDAQELQPQLPHVVHLEARPEDSRGRGLVTIRDLFRASLRLRPDRIVVGEVRGGEALDLVQAMISGHGGCLTTVHASYPRDAMNRLETLALMSDVDLPLFALRTQLASAIDIVVQTSRLADGSRCVTHISQVAGYSENDGYILEDLFARHIVGKKPDGTIETEFARTAYSPRCRPVMEAMGVWNEAWGESE